MSHHPSHSGGGKPNSNKSGRGTADTVSGMDSGVRSGVTNTNITSAPNSDTSGVAIRNFPETSAESLSKTSTENDNTKQTENKQKENDATGKSGSPKSGSPPEDGKDSPSSSNKRADANLQLINEKSKKNEEIPEGKGVDDDDLTSGSSLSQDAHDSNEPSVPGLDFSRLSGNDIGSTGVHNTRNSGLHNTGNTGFNSQTSQQSQQSTNGIPTGMDELDPNHKANKATKEEIEARDLDPERVVAYVQNLRTRYNGMTVMNVLLANDFILKDKRFNELCWQTVRENSHLFEPHELDEQKVQESYEQWAIHIRNKVIDKGKNLAGRGYFDPSSTSYIDKLVRGAWTVFADEVGQGNHNRSTPDSSVLSDEKSDPSMPEIPWRALQSAIHPIVRRACNFFTLPRNKGVTRSLGYCFLCFRSRPLYDRFKELISNLRITVGSTKKLQISLARIRTLDELKVYFRYDLRKNTTHMKRNLNVFWFDEKMEELKPFFNVANRLDSVDSYQPIPYRRGNKDSRDREHTRDMKGDPNYGPHRKHSKDHYENIKKGGSSKSYDEKSRCSGGSFNYDSRRGSFERGSFDRPSAGFNDYNNDWSRNEHSRNERPWTPINSNMQRHSPGNQHPHNTYGKQRFFPQNGRNYSNETHHPNYRDGRHFDNGDGHDFHNGHHFDSRSGEYGFHYAGRRGDYGNLRGEYGIQYNSGGGGQYDDGPYAPDFRGGFRQNLGPGSSRDNQGYSQGLGCQQGPGGYAQGYQSPGRGPKMGYTQGGHPQGGGQQGEPLYLPPNLVSNLDGGRGGESNFGLNLAGPPGSAEDASVGDPNYYSQVYEKYSSKYGKSNSNTPSGSANQTPLVNKDGQGQQGYSGQQNPNNAGQSFGPTNGGNNFDNMNFAGHQNATSNSTPNYTGPNYIVQTPQFVSQFAQKGVFNSYSTPASNSSGGQGGMTGSMTQSTMAPPSGGNFSRSSYRSGTPAVPLARGTFDQDSEDSRGAQALLDRLTSGLTMSERGRGELKNMLRTVLEFQGDHESLKDRVVAALRGRNPSELTMLLDLLQEAVNNENQPHLNNVQPMGGQSNQSYDINSPIAGPNTVSHSSSCYTSSYSNPEGFNSPVRNTPQPQHPPQLQGKEPGKDRGRGGRGGSPHGRGGRH